MSTEFTAAVEIVSRDEQVYDDLGQGVKLSRVQITRQFTGDIEGTSAANLMLAQPDGAFVAQERFTGSIGGRAGTVVFSHGKVNSSEGLTAWGVIVAGSGTGELEGVGGTAVLSFADGKSTMTIRFAD